MAAKVKNGDIVRVVLEGRADWADTQGFAIGKANENFISPAASHVKSIEVLAPPVKVGDRVGKVDELPVGTVLLDAPATPCCNDANAYKKVAHDRWESTSDYWRRTGKPLTDAGMNYSVFTVLHLP